MEILKWLIGAGVGITISALFFDTLQRHDEAIMKAGDAYTMCIEAKYGMTPQEYLARSGSYPQCP